MSAIPSVSSAAPANSANAFNSITSEDFVKIMFSELANQDPLSPSDTKAVLDQISSIRSIESDLKLSSKLTSLVSQNEFTSAGTLIGKFASGITSDGKRVGDLVLSVSSTKNGATHNLASGDKVLMSRVDEIIDPAVINALNGGSASGADASTSAPTDTTSG